MRRGAVLSPRRAPAGFEDRASRGGRIGGPRVNRYRLRRRVARRARRVAGRLLLAALGAVALCAAALLVGWLLASPRFAVASVEVSGQSRLTREEIEAAAGIAPGVNIFALDTQRVVARLLALPIVRRADVIRTLPNRVAIVVEERRPFTLVHAGTLHWIDEHGVDLGPEPRAVSLGAPVISGLGEGDLGGGHGETTDRAAAGLALLRLLLRSGSGLLQSISEIDVSRAEGPVLYTVDGVEVRLGKDDWEPRLGRLLGVLAQLKASGETVTSIDLRFRDQVVLKTPVK
jgi:cell division protein FtsQ